MQARPQTQRSGATTRLIQLPVGSSPEELMALLDADGDGSLDAEEFVRNTVRIGILRPWRRSRADFFRNVPSSVAPVPALAPTKR